ncbi:unnamed protein product [Trichogramma brassicae]|uniref:Uncharacterized protein n=1 Tax=Trichogramma brassicae TaxID=86971 RepID=A0A6H5ITM2_9HYME|nr:unnamed protein product [Trichogramma brassicae]
MLYLTAMLYKLPKEFNYCLIKFCNGSYSVTQCRQQYLSKYVQKRSKMAVFVNYCIRDRQSELLYTRSSARQPSTPAAAAQQHQHHQQLSSISTAAAQQPQLSSVGTAAAEQRQPSRSPASTHHQPKWVSISHCSSETKKIGEYGADECSSRVSEKNRKKTYRLSERKSKGRAAKKRANLEFVCGDFYPRKINFLGNLSCVPYGVGSIPTRRIFEVRFFAWCGRACARGGAGTTQKEDPGYVISLRSGKKTPITVRAGSDRITISRSPRRGLTKLAIDGAQHSHDEVRSENHTHKRAPDAGAKAQLERMMAPEARTTLTR